ncbi:MAG: hypothetical protein IH823_08890 [Candidatus Dadabacteria bacterium]|nr:hypothetical protein [Candidatus Dadabacteria bacterium]
MKVEKMEGYDFDYVGGGSTSPSPPQPTHSTLSSFEDTFSLKKTFLGARKKRKINPRKKAQEIVARIKKKCGSASSAKAEKELTDVNIFLQLSKHIFSIQD